MIKTNTITQHDVTKGFPLPDSCIDVVFTSPPYWGLRDYGVDGQIGLERHPQEYIDKLVSIGHEIKRVLKKSGSFYLNLGDTYCSSPKGDKKAIINGGKGDKWDNWRGGKNKLKDIKVVDKSKLFGMENWLQPKQLMLIPSRVAIALQDDGWVLRNDIIWHKPNSMPSSVKDRLNNTYEHVFHFVKSRKYYYDLDAIREPYSLESVRRLFRGIKLEEKTGLGYTNNNKIANVENPNIFGGAGMLTGRYYKKVLAPGQKEELYRNENIIPSGGDNKRISKMMKHVQDNILKGKGKNPGDIVKHDIAVGRIGNFSYNDPLHTREYNPNGKNPGDFWDITTQPFTSYSRDLEHFAVFSEELVIKPLKASCPRGGVVLDPFCGRGTVGKVAKELGLHYVLFDINPKYCELARLYIGGQKRKLIKNQERLFT